MLDFMYHPPFAGPVLVLCRAFGVCATAPLVSTPVVPQRVRFAIALAVTVPCVSLASVTRLGRYVSWSAFLPSLIAELFFGALLGLAAACVLEGFRFAGAVIDQGAGTAMVRALGPDEEQAFGPLARLALTAALLAFFITDGHLLVIKAFLSSLDGVPPGAWSWSAVSGVDFIVGVSSTIVVLGIRLALPALFLLFLLELSATVLSRAFPSLAPVAGNRGLRALTGVAASLALLWFAGPFASRALEAGLVLLGGV